MKSATEMICNTVGLLGLFALTAFGMTLHAFMALAAIPLNLGAMAFAKIKNALEEKRNG